MSSFNSTLEYLFAQLPMYHRIGEAAYKANLDNTQRIMEVLQHPHQNFLTVHIAGTNGKGSVSHSLASILQQAGYKTGLYTSPHLKDFRERIRIDGKMIDKKYVTDFVQKNKQELETIKPSFFEWTVGLALQYFKDKNVDIAIIETGLGGRLDSTNVITPVLSVITNISLDHINLLGNSVAKIAREKAGIIKPGVPVVIGEHDEATAKIFEQFAKKNKAPIVFASQNFRVRKSITKIKSGNTLKLDVNKGKKKLYEKLQLDLTGDYQLKNVCTVLQSVEMLQEFFKIKPRDIYAGLKSVSASTGLQGRWQVIAGKPMTVCDTAHNVAGIQIVLKQIEQNKFKQLHIVFGMVNDKDIASILKIMPAKATYYFCKPNIPRGLDAEQLLIKAQAFNLKGKAYRTVRLAYNAARKSASQQDFIFIGGSTFVVAEVI